MASTTVTLPNRGDPSAEPLRMSYDEYLVWYDREAGRRGEWVDGEVIVFMPTTYLHERLVNFLAVLLGFVIASRRLGVVLGSGYELRLQDGSAREPDLQVVLNEHRNRITDRRLVGAADLVVEVVSADSITRDRRDKLSEYAAAGVPEYWLVDPRLGRERFEMMTLDAERRYVAVAPDADGRLRSLVLPDVWIDPSWLAAEELPDVSALAMRMAGLDGGST